MKKLNLLFVVLGVFFNPQKMAAQGQLWGTLAQGGEYDLGAIIKLNADGTGFSIEKSVAIEANNPGYSPVGGLIQAQNGKIYGVTEKGGSNNKGVLFEFNPTTGVYTKKIDFSNNDGSNPTCGLTEANGKLYGGTRYGGFNDQGNIFEFDPATGIVLERVALKDYGIVTGSMIFAHGKLYGVLYGNSGPVIFSVELTTYSLTILSAYYDIQSPVGGLAIANNGKFYGQTNGGGINGYGILYEYDPFLKTISKKVDFSKETGTSPRGELTLANNGKLYGLCGSEGANGCRV
jgi:uncharacterized repeat protein (TIGR03803 family)